MPRCGQPEEARQQGEGGGLEGGYVVDAKVTVHLGGTRVCVCVCACVRVCVCVRACVCVHVHMHLVLSRVAAHRACECRRGGWAAQRG